MNYLTHIQILLETFEQDSFIEEMDRLKDVISILRMAKFDGKTVFTFGNGGSHSTASHFAQDLLKACNIRAICIGDMVPATYAYNNDAGKEEMFDEILFTLAHPGDIFIGFSCSGNSSNVVRPMIRKHQTKILFTGDDGGKASEYADIVIRAYNDNIRIQESIHSIYCHAIIEDLLYG